MHSTDQPIETNPLEPHEESADAIPRSEGPSSPTKATATDVGERVLLQLVQGHASLPQLAGTLGMTLRELACWAMESQNWRTLAALSRLGDLQTHMIVGRFRITAAVHLLGMASGKDSTELARRACADLLEARLDSPTTHDDQARRGGGSRSPAGGGWPAGILPNISAPTEREILAALEELGREEDADAGPPEIAESPPQARGSAPASAS